MRLNPIGIVGITFAFMGMLAFQAGFGLAMAKPGDVEPAQKSAKPLAKGVTPFVLDASEENLNITENLATLEAQAKAYPNNVEAQFLLAVAYTRTNHLDKALKTLQKTKKLVKRQPERYVVMDDLMREYESMAAYREKDPQLYYRLAFGYYLKGYGIEKGYIKNEPTSPQKWYTKAEEAMRQVLALNAKDIWARNYLGYFLAERAPEQNLDQAVRLWEDSVQIDPVNPVAWVMLSEVALKQGKLKQALDFANKGMQAGAEPTENRTPLFEEGQSPPEP